MKRTVIVVGAGITGLTAAYALSKTSSSQVMLLESGASIGGKIATERRSGCLLELGPDTIHDRTGIVYALLAELGLIKDVVVPLAGVNSILHQGALYGVDNGIMGSLTGQARALWSTKAVSLRGKLRAVLGNFTSPKVSVGDISIADYARARWGKEFSQVVVEPLLAGMLGGGGARLSMKALYPHLINHKVRGEGSRARPRVFRKVPPIFALKHGLSSMVQALRAQLPREALQVRARVKRVDLNHDGKGVKLELESGKVLTADACIVATPAYESAKLLAHSLPDEASVLSSIPFASTVSVTLGFPLDLKSNIPRGNGFIGTEVSDSMIGTCSLSSRKWPGRSPREILLARCFPSRKINDRCLTYSDEKLSQLFVSELRKIFSDIPQPLFVRIKRWEQAVPQYELGHIEKVKRLEGFEEMHPELRFAGASFRGSSVASCVRDAQRVANKIHFVLTTLQSKGDITTDRTEEQLSPSKYDRTKELQNA